MKSLLYKALYHSTAKWNVVVYGVTQAVAKMANYLAHALTAPSYRLQKKARDYWVVNDLDSSQLQLTKNTPLVIATQTAYNAQFKETNAQSVEARIAACKAFDSAYKPFEPDPHGYGMQDNEMGVTR